MVRKKLMWYTGASYHITSRGNHRNDIFRDGEDYLVYLTILEEALKKYNCVDLLLFDDKSCTFTNKNIRNSCE